MKAYLTCPSPRLTCCRFSCFSFWRSSSSPICRLWHCNTRYGYR